MNSDQQLLISLLSSAIHGDKPKTINNCNPDWTAVFKEAKTHDVYSLLYPVIKNLDTHCCPDNKLKLFWQKAALLTAATQAKYIKEISSVLYTLHQAEIPVIALKGLVLRELYPIPELRTMCDADILIYKHDIGRTKKILLEAGYIEEASSPLHMQFTHKSYLTIELHWSLTNRDYLQAADSFTEDAWKNTEPFIIKGTPVMTLSPEAQIMYLCLHMASHIICSGFGLRQLCDLVLIIEAKKEMVNWSSFWMNSKVYGIERFAFILFVICNKLFGLDISCITFGQKLNDTLNTDKLIEEILTGGVYGKSTLDRSIGVSLLASENYKGSKIIPGKLSYYTSLLFPPMNEIGEKYSYSKKYPFLIPISWIHRLVYGIFFKNSSGLDKTSFLRAANIYKKRASLLRWMELK